MGFVAFISPNSRRSFGEFFEIGAIESQPKRPSSAIPVIGSVITSAIHTLVLVPVYYTLHKRWEQWRRQPKSSVDQTMESQQERQLSVSEVV